MKRACKGALLLTAVLLAAALAGCRDLAPAETLYTPGEASATAKTATVLIEAASPTATAVPPPTPVPVYPTVTPRETFVPIPTATPDPAMKFTPSPTPTWATPYPSPSGSPSVTLSDTVEMVRVDTRAYVNGSLAATSWHIGTAEPGSMFPLEYDGFRDYIRIDYNGVKGYVRRDCCTVQTTSALQTGDIRYTAASFNAHNLGQGRYVEQAGAYLREVGADIVGIQEIDKGTQRAGGLDLTRLLAEAAGYPYWSFHKAINYSGGAYGTAILSKYPILDRATFPLDGAPGKERRSLGYVRVLTPAGAVSVFNTHLCPSSMCFKSYNLVSLRFELARADVGTYIVTGDFNCSPSSLSKLLPSLHYANMTGNTFGDGTTPKIIDNILYADGVQVYNIEIAAQDAFPLSDHRLLKADILIRE